MKYSYHPMTLVDANEIITWKYDDAYSINNFSGEDDELSELMNGEYISTYDAEENLVGFICHGESARVPGGTKAGFYKEQDYIDIGLGLKPDLTGKKMGFTYFKSRN
ncbi:hypothetical protein [Paenibacillus caui]|uniref:hypothetical protein n=1 Tax=Paenibacillus caui TaxID=2873927 RepID=UPI001CA8F95C|nr:hypothetical protein [Paenibacillus caui]